MARIPTRTWWLPLLALVGFAAVTWPVWQWLWFEWMSNDYYSHGLLILPVAIFLAVQRVRNDQAFVYTPGQGSGWGVLLLAVALAAYLYALQQRAYYLAAFAMIGMAAGLVWAMAGAAVLRKLAFPIGYLALMIPLPLLDRITLPLALFTGYCSGSLVQFLGMDIAITGNAIALPNADLVIGAQCSGVNSLITLVALLVLGPNVIFGFTAAITLGIFVGTYSSIYMASPILIWLRVNASSFVPVETAVDRQERLAREQQ